MAHIEINFDEVPDKFQPVDPGTYTFEVMEASEEPTKDGTGKKAVVVLKIADDGPMNGRQVWDHIGYKNKVQLKRIYWSCYGTKPGAAGFDLSDLVGKHCKASITNRTYQQDGETKETSSVKEYLVPADVKS